MSDIEEKLKTLENIIIRYNIADEIIFILLTSNERGNITRDDQVKVGGMVHGLNDEILSNLYDRILESGRMPGLYQPIQPNDYFAFIQRLGTLLIEATIQANEADIALRKAIGLNSVIGIWGKKEWCPSGQW